MGFSSVDENVQVTERASFYGSSQIKIESIVQIDDFCVQPAVVGGIATEFYLGVTAKGSKSERENLFNSRRRS